MAKFSFKLVCNDAPSLLQAGKKKLFQVTKGKNVIADEALMLYRSNISHTKTIPALHSTSALRGELSAEMPAGKVVNN